MSFISGSTELTICKLSAKLPEDFLSKLAAHSIGKIEDVKTDPVLGWAGWRHFQAPVDEAEAICGGHLHIQLVKTERKIPGTALKDACKRAEIAWMQVNGREHCPSKERKSIRAELSERLLAKYPPTVTSIPIAVDRTYPIGLLYAGTASPKQLDNVIALFHKSLGVEPVPFTPAFLMQFAQDAKEIPSLRIAGAEDDLTPGRDFLTWLWYFAETEGAKLPVSGCGVFEAMIEGPLTFAASEAKGALLTVVKKGGCPQASAEAKAALESGKKLKKAKLTIVREKRIWSGIFDADTFSFSGFNLPEGEAMEINSRFDDTLLDLDTIAHALAGYFHRFVEDLRKPETVGLIRKWAQDRESY